MVVIFFSTNRCLFAGIWLGCCFRAGVSVDDVYAAVRARIQPQGVLVMSEPAFSHQWPRSGRPAMPVKSPAVQRGLPGRTPRAV